MDILLHFIQNIRFLGTQNQTSFIYKGLVVPIFPYGSKPPISNGIISFWESLIPSFCLSIRWVSFMLLNWVMLWWWKFNWLTRLLFVLLFCSKASFLMDVFPSFPLFYAAICRLGRCISAFIFSPSYTIPFVRIA